MSLAGGLRKFNVANFICVHLCPRNNFEITNENVALWLDIDVHALGDADITDFQFDDPIVLKYLALRNIPVSLTIVDSVTRVTTTTRGKISWIGEAMDIWVSVTNKDYHKAVSIVKRLETRTQVLLGIKFRQLLNEDFELLGGLIDYAKLQNGEKVDGMGYTTGAENLDNISKRLLEILNRSREELSDKRPRMW